MPMSFVSPTAPSHATLPRWRRGLAAALGLVPLLLPLLFGAGEALASRGNPGGFSLAAQSSVPYTATPLRAALDCAAMNTTFANGIPLSAQLIAATAKAPEHCRIRGTLAAEVGFELNLPTQWNGRLWMYGNGGFAGEDNDAPKEAESRETGLSKGFATARTDTGHLSAKEPLATFAYYRPDKLIDHAYRAVHETVVLAKQVIATYYARSASYAYWDGCSTGGRQGMMSAYRYPQDFDGILAGAPTLRWSDVMMKGLSNQRALDSAPTLTQAKLANVFKRVLAKCDAKDGVTDGLISHPPACDFDPAQDLPRCTGATGDDCYSEAEINALARLRAGPRIKGREYFPQHWGVEHPTTSVPWLFLPGSANGLTVFGQSYMKYWAFPNQDPAYDWTKFDFDTDPDRMAHINSLLNPQPDLAAFRDRKGKILTYWGWADAALNVVMGTDYHDAVSARLGAAETQSFYRMFLVPGLAHCGGGYGPNQIDGMTPLIEWVEGGKAPERLRARLLDANGATTYDRAYCAYPKRTAYAGGDPEKAESWRCEEPPAAAAPDTAAAGGCSTGNGSDASLPLLLMGAWFARRRRLGATVQRG
ncbi:tannase/feruloyl esterase family alpha/beta hydrolase [Aquincola sp. S2]|uniref:Tannase/feruloyl esterase family alpha/beta hydrolase n=1 Tax=Pseudaquabacterium terrae TaxID=2732868 RepID=A0ABX2EPX3_9BURK|nr:tannase/feruloyl esterase family alpha/beta hydrolase [Aquabacterium terrae]NRF70619.1 tannase/feruloyl esterase family alpha/beta hydrolase [Aquabacterium terrae]